MKTIDMTPTWEETARILVMILQVGSNEEGQEFALKEVLRMGTIIDQYQAAEKEKAA